MCRYAVDVKIVLDATSTMRPILDGVKLLAGELHKAIAAGVEVKGKHIGCLRVSVIAFRDFGCDGQDAFIDSGFFTFPDDEPQFVDFMSKITIFGGGDEPENSLEALAYALQGEWTSEELRQRHVTVLFTDAPPHPYGTVTGSGKPSGLPETLDQCLDIWRGDRPGFALSQRGKRLYLVVPSGNEEYSRWGDEEHVAVMAVDAVHGCPRAAMNFIVSTVVNSC